MFNVARYWESQPEMPRYAETRFFPSLRGETLGAGWLFSKVGTGLDTPVGTIDQAPDGTLAYTTNTTIGPVEATCKLQIHFDNTKPPVCKDASFYIILMDWLVNVGELNSASTFPGMRLYEPRTNFSLEFGPTSRAGMENLQQFMVVGAIEVLAKFMYQAPATERYRPFQGIFRFNNKIVGAVNMWQGLMPNVGSGDMWSISPDVGRLSTITGASVQRSR